MSTENCPRCGHTENSVQCRRCNWAGPEEALDSCGGEADICPYCGNEDLRCLSCYEDEDEEGVKTWECATIQVPLLPLSKVLANRLQAATALALESELATSLRRVKELETELAKLYEENRDAGHIGFLLGMDAAKKQRNKEEGK